MGRKALDMPGAARQDWWITQEIARRLELDWHYANSAEIYEEMRSCMPSIKGISWERLLAESAVTYPCKTETDPGQPIVFGDGFPTASRRGKFVPAKITSDNEPPDEEYPMVLTTGTQLEHWHTGAMSRRSDVLDTLEPEAVANLCAHDLVRLGIDPGDMIRVQTRRGVIELKARVNPAVPTGMVFVPFCFVDASANLLTSAKLDPIGKIPGFKLCGARVEKAAAQADIQSETNLGVAMD